MVASTGPVSLQSKPASSNIFQLPQLSGMQFSVTNNAGWYDSIVFTQSPTSLVPIDLSGINFHAELRINPGDARNALDMNSTAVPPTLVNGGPNGTLFFSVDITAMNKLSVGTYVMDILATDAFSGMVRNLCETAPLTVLVNQGITR